MLYEQTGSWTTCLYGSAVMALVAAALAVHLKAVRPSTASTVAVPAVAK